MRFLLYKLNLRKLSFKIRIVSFSKIYMIDKIITPSSFIFATEKTLTNVFYPLLFQKIIILLQRNIFSQIYDKFVKI